MNKEEFFKQHTGRYRLIKMVIGGNDCSDTYVSGWEDKSLYMYLEITEDGKFLLKAHGGGMDKEYEYFFNHTEMKYYLKPDYSDAGTPITIKYGVITEETDNHLMVYELTNELD